MPHRCIITPGRTSRTIGISDRADPALTFSEQDRSVITNAGVMQIVLAFRPINRTVGRLITDVPPFFMPISLAFARLSAYAESGSDDESKTQGLTKESQNPVVNLISVPFKNNFNCGVGPNDVTQCGISTKPVKQIPISYEQ
jgi:hypothetical protein